MMCAWWTSTEKIRDIKSFFSDEIRATSRSFLCVRPWDIGSIIKVYKVLNGHSMFERTLRDDVLVRMHRVQEQIAYPGSNVD